MATKEFEVKRLKNHKGDSHLVIIVKPAVENIEIGTLLIVPYAEGLKDPKRVVIQMDGNGNPKTANNKFAIIDKFIY